MRGRSCDSNGLVLRSDYFGDPLAWRAFCDLLFDIFRFDVSPLTVLGGPDPTSMPTGYFDADGRCIANLSAFSMPMMMDGKHIKAAGWQSGAVRPEWRGRGLFRDLMQITFDRCRAAGFETILLTTRHPALYQPLGFRTVPQWRFSGPVPALPGGIPPARRLDIRQPGDLALICEALRCRQPVSDRFAVLDQSHMFLLNAWLSPSISLHWMEQEHCVLASELTNDERLSLLDVVGAAIPSLGTLIGATAPMATHVDVNFPTDRICADGQPWDARAEPDEGATVLMMWSLPMALPHGSVKLSPMADF
ncbi:GNAT family N-acetyltransferase [Rhizobium sp. 0TCS1.26]|uniref:GNAT family N-acetyltransferase n=1 Tax=Rhizobium sp. 0TCS1.26 TaxID=3142623 RepID=UPI003D2D095E